MEKAELKSQQKPDNRVCQRAYGTQRGGAIRQGGEQEAQLPILSDGKGDGRICRMPLYRSVTSG